ncbi:hypothetical protein Tco_1364541, partial [Tanacetum coccineum]
LAHIADADLEEDPEEDPEKDPADHTADGGDDDEPFKDDVDGEDEEEASEEEDDDDEEEEHLAPADSSTIPTIDPVPSAEDTEAFEANESAPTPPPPRSCRAGISVRLSPPIAASMEARIAEFEIGESSAAVARQPGSSVARGADYSFVDTDDRAALRAKIEDVDDHATGAMMRIHVLEARAHIDTLEDTSSSA